MEWIESTGESVEQAVEVALDQLGVDESELEYEVVEEAQRGFLKRRPARIRARIRPVSREKPDTRRRRGRREGGGDDAAAGGSSAPAGRRERVVDGPTGAAGRIDPATVVPSAAPSGAEVTAPTERAARTPRPPRDRDSEPALTEAELLDQAGVAQEFLQGLVAGFGVSATVSSQVVDGGVHVDVKGDQLGLLIGPRGVTSDALHELTRTALQRHAGGQAARVAVDVAGYRERRRQALEEFTREVAARAVETGRDQVLEPMSPPDRKVVHDVCGELDGVATGSEGEEPRRRVVIRRG